MPRGKPDVNYKGVQPLNARQKTAARLIAANTMTLQRIAQELKVTTQTIINWRSRDDFQELLQEYGDEIAQATSTLRFSDSNRRIEALNKLAIDYETIVAERAFWYAENEPEIPGGRTGHLTRQERMLGLGKNSRIVVEHVIDSKLDEGFKNTLIHIAKERGEWSERKELTGPGGAALLPIREIIVTLPAEFAEDDPEDEPTSALVPSSNGASSNGHH